MKFLFLVLLIVMPLTSNAICLKTFNLSGLGKTQELAENDLEMIAGETCGNDEYAWPARRSPVSFEETVNENGYQIRASARYQCCMQW